MKHADASRRSLERTFGHAGMTPVALDFSEAGKELWGGWAGSTVRAQAPPVTRELDALFAAVWMEPATDAPRAVLADVLTEQGDPRGEFITLQLARAQGTSTPPGGSERRRCSWRTSKPGETPRVTRRETQLSY